MDTVGLQQIQLIARQESARLHHYFVGVEHLFVALTQLKGGLTTAVLEDYGLSPRFVRYSIRESVGRYEDRRFWPGFQETPRALEVQSIARRYAGLQTPTERDMLLAILDEGDSVVIRVLHEMGVDVADLRQRAANWKEQLRPRAPDVPIQSPFPLSADQERVIRTMFRDSGNVNVLSELADGMSGARVLLARPVNVTGRNDAPVVVKLHDRESILYERRRYDLHVKGTLPTSAARLVDAPAVPDDCVLGGLKYTFVGRADETEPMSLRDFAREREPEAVIALINTLFEVFGPAWYLQNQPFRFGVWREYEHVLPPALVIEAEPAPRLTGSERILTPLGAWSRASYIMPGELVVLRGFAVQKLNLEKGVLHLAAGPQAEAINRSCKVEVRGLRLSPTSHFRGDLIDEVVGRVVSTRDDILLRQVRALEPEFDLRQSVIPSANEHVEGLPNPLHQITALLERQVNGHLSSIHGDLHVGNILVGLWGDAWLIDFFWARDGHTLFDWALLEVSLLVDVIVHFAPDGWSGVWEIIELVSHVNRGEAWDETHPAAGMIQVIEAVRAIVQQCLAAQDRWTEYYIAVALLALRCIGWDSLTLNGRRLALLISALAVREVQRTSMGGEGTQWPDVTTDMDQTELRYAGSIFGFEDEAPTEQVDEEPSDKNINPFSR